MFVGPHFAESKITLEAPQTAPIQPCELDWLHASSFASEKESRIVIAV